MRGSGSASALVLASVLSVRVACAQGANVLPENSPASPGSATDGSEPLAAEVVFVGVSEDTGELTAVIGDLLRVRRISARFEHRAELTEQDLSAEQRATRPTVWILFPKLATVRLVFADYAHQRFLVREIPLAHGLDELGRESVGQVVESSLLALLHGVSGVGRAEAQSALGRYLKKPQPAAYAAAAPRPTPEPKTSPRRISQRLGLEYVVAWSGGEFGVEQGPQILSGVELVGRDEALFVVAALESHFAQHQRGSAFDLTLQNNRGWLLFGWRRALNHLTSLSASFGPGLDVTRVTAEALARGATAEPSSLAWSPWLQACAGLEWGGKPLSVQLSLRTDVSLYRTHYDADANGTKKILARPSIVRPGVALGVLWR